MVGCGDAMVAGGLDSLILAAPVVGIAATSDGKGYGRAAADSGVVSFGSAPFEGSTGGKPVTAPVVGIAAFAGAVPG